MNALQASEPNFRGWSSADLSSYAVVRRTPLCSQQLQHRICTVPAPSSGGLALLQTLALLNQSSNLASCRHACGLAAVSYTHLTLPTICSV